MAGAGYKLFNTGDVLTAAQVNTYLQEQAVMRFANATARTTALSGVLAEGMVSYLMDTNAVEVYDGSAWVGVGNVGDITGVTAGTGISGGGTSGTVTITNSMATEITAAGDIIVGTGSGTFDNLPIGTTGQVLTADTTVSPYKVKWATAGGGSGLTLVKRATFSNVANTGTTFDGVFTSTYGSYLVMIESLDANTLSNDPQMQLRSGGTTKTNNYYSANLSYASDATTASSLTTSSNTLWTLSPNALITGQLFFNGSNVMGHTIDAMGPSFNIIQGFVDSYGPDGFLLKSSSSNINGTVSVYGLAKS